VSESGVVVYKFKRNPFLRVQKYAKAKAVLQILAARGLPMSDDGCQCVLSCLDQDQLDTWLVRAITVESTEELFGPVEHLETFVSEPFRRHQAIGKAEAVLEVPAARGIRVPDDVRERVEDCREWEQLDRWLVCAVTAESVGEVFG
jgi:hypothetical protein